MRRTLMLIAALTIPVSGAAMVGFAGTASATKPPKPVKVKFACSTITGTLSGTIVVGGCSGGNTGGSSVALVATTLATGGTITWTSGATTTISAPSLTTVTTSKCTGTAEKFTATITGGSGSDMPVSGTSSGEVCFNTATGAIKALKPMKTKGVA